MPIKNEKVNLSKKKAKAHLSAEKSSILLEDMGVYHNIDPLDKRN